MKPQNLLPQGRPILGESCDDFTQSKFVTTIDRIRYNGTVWLISLDIIVNNQTVEQLVEEGKAEIYLHVENPTTRYRKLHSFNRDSENRYYVEIEGDELLNKVNFFALICTTSTIENVFFQDQHEDYEDTRFNILQGDILALSNESHFYAEYDFDNISKINSILDIKINEDVKDGNMKILVDGDRLELCLPESDYNKYNELKAQGNLTSILGISVVFPVILYAVQYLHNNKEDRSEIRAECRWARCLLHKIEQGNLDLNAPENIYPIAQEILSQPMSRFLASVDSNYN